MTQHVRAPGIRATFETPTSDADLPRDPDELVAGFFDPVRRGELYHWYHALRAVAPVHRAAVGMPGVWLVTRFEDAAALYRNPRAVSDPKTAEHFNHGGAGGAFYQMLRQMMLFLESERHAHVRRIVVKAFTPRSIAKVQPVTETVAAALLDELRGEREMELMTQFAYRLPLTVIARIMGVPDADLPIIEDLAWDFARGSEAAAVVDDRTRRADAAAVGFADYFAHLIERRRHDPRDDVLSALIAAEDDGETLSRDEAVATAVLLLQAGHETTTDSLGNAMVALFRHPGELERLRREPSLTKAAVEELLRYDSTNQMNNRLLLDDTVVGDVTIPAGDQVGIVIGAANRDPAAFDAPDALRLDRDIPLHLAFAWGAYYCVGNALARAELQVALRALLDGLPGLRPASDTFEWRSTYRNRGPQELRVAWDG